MNKNKKVNKYLFLVFIPIAILIFMLCNRNHIDNYYLYVNEEEISEKETEWSYILEQEEEIEKETNEIIQKMLENPQTEEEKNIKELYDKLLANLTDEECNYIKNYIQEIENASNIQEYIKTITKIEKDLNIEIITSKSIMKDFKTGKNIIYFMPVSMDYNLTSDYYTNNDLIMIKNNIKLYNNKLLVKYGLTPGEALDASNEINELYTDIANNSLSNDELLKIDNYYKKVNLEELKKIFSNIDIETYLNTLEIPNVAELSIVDINQYKRVNDKLNNEYLSNWKNIAKIKILQNYSFFLSDEFQKLEIDITNKMYNKEINEKKEYVYNLIKTIYPNEISRLYREKYLNENTVNYLQTMTKEIIEEYKNLISNSSFSESAKKVGIKKLENIKINIGKTYEKDYASYYKLESNKNALESYIALKKEEKKRMLNSINQETTYDNIQEYTFNAYYKLEDNSINILTGIIKEINSEDNKYNNLGKIGTIIAHEISHAFDNNGSKFDENGLLNNWFTKEDEELFENKKKKISEYFDNYEIISGINNNGNRTIGENIADLSAIECITKIISNASNNEKKQFFESYAKLWSSNESKSIKVFSSLIDSHSISEIRVNGTLSSNEMFYDVYKIKTDDFMYIEKDKRVNVWN